MIRSYKEAIKTSSSTICVELLNSGSFTGLHAALYQTEGNGDATHSSSPPKCL